MLNETGKKALYPIENILRSHSKTAGSWLDDSTKVAGKTWAVRKHFAWDKTIPMKLSDTDKELLDKLKAA